MGIQVINLLERLEEEEDLEQIVNFYKIHNIKGFYKYFDKDYLTKKIRAPQPPIYELFISEWDYYGVGGFRIECTADRKKLILKDTNNASEIFKLPASEINYYKCVDELLKLWKQS